MAGATRSASPPRSFQTITAAAAAATTAAAIIATRGVLRVGADEAWLTRSRMSRVSDGDRPGVLQAWKSVGSGSVMMDLAERAAQLGARAKQA